MKTVASNTCLVCNSACSLPDDIILINPSTDLDLKIAKDRLAFAQEKKKKEKAEKKKTKEMLKKRKADGQEDGPAPLLEGSSDEEKKKAAKKAKKAAALEGAATKKEKSINMTLPDLSALEAPKSKAVASLYHANGEGENKGNYLTRGTFNRFAP